MKKHLVASGLAYSNMGTIVRRIILTFFAAISIAYAGAQTLTPEQFPTELDKIKQQSELEQAYSLNSQIAHLYERLSKDVQDSCSYKRYMSNIYYNYACYACRLGKTAEAGQAIVRAAELGYNDAAWATEDTDLIPLHDTKAMKEALAIMEKNSPLTVLKSATPYATQSDLRLNFSYDFDSPEYAHTREYFNLDSVAGNGDEVSRIKNLMYFVHDLVRHDGNTSNPKERDAISLYEVCKCEGRGINCRMMAIMLNEMYLSLGIPSRYVTCLPIDENDNDCHVINAVYSRTLDKWLWMDPTFAAYVCDDEGTLLSIEEVRERLISDKPLVLNDDANWNHKNKQTAERYLYNYMAKNLYLLECPTESKWGVESTFLPSYNLLTPSADTECWEKRNSRVSLTVTTDADTFWQKP